MNRLSGHGERAKVRKRDNELLFEVPHLGQSQKTRQWAALWGAAPRLKSENASTSACRRPQTTDSLDESNISSLLRQLKAGRSPIFRKMDESTLPFAALRDTM